MIFFSEEFSLSRTCSSSWFDCHGDNWDCYHVVAVDVSPRFLLVLGIPKYALVQSHKPSLKDSR